MTVPDKEKSTDPEVTYTNAEPQLSGDDSEPEAPVAEGGASHDSGSTHKKKNKSKAKKVLNALSGKKEIPQEIVDRVLEKVKEDNVQTSVDLNAENVRKALKEMKVTDVVKGKASAGGYNKKAMGEHKFWSTQPVPQLGEGPPEADGYIEPSKPREEVRQEPYPLPDDFEWATLDINDPAQNKEVHDLLTLNYVEDDYASFRFKYSSEFLTWALKPPGYVMNWHVGVRVSKTKKLVSFISGVPMTLRIRELVIPVTEINYLCVHKKLRSKRLAPVLIKEVTRRVHLEGTFQAIYTAGVILPTPVSVCQYYHRLLNIQKLVDTHFAYVPRNMTLARMIRVNKVPENMSLPGLREMQDRDIVEVTTLFERYMKRFDLAPVFTVEEARHQFLSGGGQGELGSGGPGRREGQVTWSYVVEDPETKKITDFFSFYSLPSTVINNEKYPLLEAAYLYYYAMEVGTVPNAEQDKKIKNRLLSLITDALVIANNAKFDVFNALTLMDNVPVLKDLKFGVGDGFLNYYLYNWRTKPLSGMRAEGDTPAGRGIGVVML